MHLLEITQYLFMLYLLVIQQFIFYFRNKVAFFAFDVENNNRPTLLVTGILYGLLNML